MNLALIGKNSELIYTSFTSEITQDNENLLVCSRDGSNTAVIMCATAVSTYRGNFSIVKQTSGVYSTLEYKDTSVTGLLNSLVADDSLSNIATIESFSSGIPKLRIYSYSSGVMTLKQVLTLPDSTTTYATVASIDPSGTTIFVYYTRTGGVTEDSKRVIIEYNNVSGTWVQGGGIIGKNNGKVLRGGNSTGLLLTKRYDSGTIQPMIKDSGGTWVNSGSTLPLPTNGSSQYGENISSSYSGSLPDYVTIGDYGWVSSNTNRKGYFEVRQYNSGTGTYDLIWSINGMSSIFDQEDTSSYFSLSDCRISKDGKFIYIKAFKYIYIFIKQGGSYSYLDKVLATNGLVINSYEINDSGRLLFTTIPSYTSAKAKVTLGVI